MASAASLRHLEAISFNVARAARSRLHSPRLASSLAVEGTAKDEWTCLDLGTIVLHVMSETTRCQYDIESRYRQYQVHGDPVPEPLHDESPQEEEDDNVEYRVLR